MVGTVPEVVCQGDGWYEIAYIAETAFVDGANAAPGPYDIIEPQEAYVPGLGTVCATGTRIQVDEMKSIATIKAGPAQHVMDVDLYHPIDAEALEIDVFANERVADDHSPYQLGHCAPKIRYPAGIHTIGFSIDGGTYRVGFNAQWRAVYVIHVY
ncbi:MAG: hypothetical protein OXE52_18705 [Chloroflexi bacterium]|nr:hypothetical protein [Chloroflexota bacterium]